MRRQAFVLTVVALGLAGCADPELGALDRQLEEIRRNPGGMARLELPEVPRYDPVPYREGNRRSPFRQALPEPEAQVALNGELAPDHNRRREPLEAYALEDLALVGLLGIRGESYALVRSPEGEVHRLRAGSYLGNNHGRIEEVSQRSVRLVELVATGGGGWVERRVQLVLNNE